jgi:hypothetical protein
MHKHGEQKNFKNDDSPCRPIHIRFLAKGEINRWKKRKVITERKNPNLKETVDDHDSEGHGVQRSLRSQAALRDLEEGGHSGAH